MKATVVWFLFLCRLVSTLFFALPRAFKAVGEADIQNLWSRSDVLESTHSQATISSKIFTVLLSFISNVIFPAVKWGQASLECPLTHPLCHTPVFPVWQSQKKGMRGWCRPGTHPAGLWVAGLYFLPNANLCPIMFLIIPDHPPSLSTCWSFSL